MAAPAWPAKCCIEVEGRSEGTAKHVSGELSHTGTCPPPRTHGGGFRARPARIPRKAAYSAQNFLRLVSDSDHSPLPDRCLQGHEALRGLTSSNRLSSQLCSRDPTPQASWRQHVWTKVPPPPNENRLAQSPRLESHEALHPPALYGKDLVAMNAAGAFSSATPRCQAPMAKRLGSASAHTPAAARPMSPAKALRLLWQSMAFFFADIHHDLDDIL